MAKHLTIATQGGEYSFHAIAARAAAPGMDIAIDKNKRFGDVIRKSRAYRPGLGVIAINSAAGLVEESAEDIALNRRAAFPPVVDRVDVAVRLALIGAVEQSLEELDRMKVHCLAQKPAVVQCTDFLHENLPWIKVEHRSETTRAIHEVLARKSPDFVAIGPPEAAEGMGGHIIGPEQINPEGSITSFYVLQRDPTKKLLPKDPEKTSERTVLMLVHPEGDGEFAKCMELADNMEIQIARFIPFHGKHLTEHDEYPSTGGILELEHGFYDPDLTEFVARLPALKDEWDQHRRFVADRLGSYMWYEEPPIDPYVLVEQEARLRRMPEDQSYFRT